jgi:hypothetical protein
MTPQDLIIFVSNIVISFSLIPQVWYGFKEKKGPVRYVTSIPYGLSLYAIAGSYMSLGGLPLSAGITGITATLWIMLVIQRWIYDK